MCLSKRLQIPANVISALLLIALGTILLRNNIDIARNVSGAKMAATEIARNVAHSAKNLGEISGNIQKVNIGTSDTSNGIDTVRQSAEKLTSDLEVIVKQFKI